VLTIGLRREDKSRWEGRVPLVPSDVGRLAAGYGVPIRVQVSRIRAFPDAAYQEVGAQVVPELDDCDVIMGVKEIPPAKLRAGRVYVYFSHTIKGQPANMPALRRLLELGCTLIDYERIVDAQNRRLVFFGRYAGLAGMIDTLWALGQRLRHEGIDSPFARIQPAHRHRDLQQVEQELRTVGQRIRTDGLPPALCPLICGFAGYGQVAAGAQHIYDLLPVQTISPAEVATAAPLANVCYKVVFKEEHMVARIDSSASFDLQEYYGHPERYRPDFFRFVPHLTMLVNCIYWEPKYPRFVTREQFQELYRGPGQPRLRVIGDITCDVDGSLACTTRTTDPGSPVYVYDPFTGDTQDGVAGTGPVVLAVDFLPCELPVDASNYFSGTLMPFIPALAKASFSGPLADAGLPPELLRATIVYRGQFAEPYQYLREHVAGAGH